MCSYLSLELGQATWAVIVAAQGAVLAFAACLKAKQTLIWKSLYATHTSKVIERVYKSVHSWHVTFCVAKDAAACKIHGCDCAAAKRICVHAIE